MTCACTGPNAGATAPTPVPPATADTLAIVDGTDNIRAGFFADYRVVASMSDHTSQVVTTVAELTSSDPSVATIDRRGRVTAIAHGTTTLTASYQGRTIARTIKVVFNYAGTWTGTYVVRGCDQTGVFNSSKYCQNLGLEPQPFSLDLTQNGPALDEIGGAISLRNLPGPVSGRVSSDGSLLLNGSFVAPSGGFSLRVDILGWTTTPSSSTTMTGRFVYEVSVVGSDGRATHISEIVSAAKKLETTGAPGS